MDKPKVRDFYFVFMDTQTSSGAPKWHRVFTEDKWRHCLVLMDFGGDTISFDPQHYGVEVESYYNRLRDGMSVPADMVAGSYADVGHVVVHWRNNNFGGHCVYNTGTLVPTCVSMCKMFAGIRNYSFTPKQLYKWLIKNGGEEINGG